VPARGTRSCSGSSSNSCPVFRGGNEQAFADFDKQLETALGVRVEWEDREFFLIRKPTSDTVAKARVFLENYRRARSK